MQQRSVVLKHTLPDGSAHLDWMFERPGGEERRLITFRLDQDSIALPTQARRLPDHRALYLDYEGPISRGRGSVRRLETGVCRLQAERSDWVLIDVQMPAAFGRLLARETQGGQWSLSLEVADAGESNPAG